jgi:predicted ATP-dependent endonuclease of OLD family
MLESISLKFTELAAPIIVPSQGVTIFVGPNNSGKSLVLRELETALSNSAPVDSKILDDFEIIWPDTTQFEEDVQSLKRKAPVGSSPENI